MRVDHDKYGAEAAEVLGRTIAEDASGGRGHSWNTIHPDDMPANIAEEIAAEIIDGGHDECDDYLATNGQHYRW